AEDGFDDPVGRAGRELVELFPPCGGGFWGLGIADELLALVAVQFHGLRSFLFGPALRLAFGGAVRRAWPAMWLGTRAGSGAGGPEASGGGGGGARGRSGLKFRARGKQPSPLFLALTRRFTIRMRQRR